MRTLWLLSLLLVTLHACSDDGDGGDGDGNAAGNGGSANAGAGGSGGSSLAGAGGRNMAGSGGSNAAGVGGSSMAGSGNNMAGSGGSMASNATGCDAYCERSLDECQNDNVANCLTLCEMNEALCPPESAEWLDCVLPLPDSDYFCQNGVTTPNVDVCTMENAALLRCVFLGP